MIGSSVPPKAMLFGPGGAHLLDQIRLGFIDMPIRSCRLDQRMGKVALARQVKRGQDLECAGQAVTANKRLEALMEGEDG